MTSIINSDFSLFMFSSGAIQMIMQREVNMTIGYFASTSLRDIFMTSSYAYYTSNLVWMIPPGQVISSLEKLLRPFHMSVWVCFLAVLTVSFLSVGCLTFVSKKAANFTFGENVASPNLNIINMVLGGSLNKLPSRNFARTVLMMFMLYCFVIQNSYKGGLFKFMQMTVREKEMETTDEIVARNFKFYMLESSKAYLTELPRIMELAVFLGLENFTRMIDNLHDPDFKGVVLTSEDHLAYRNIQAFPKFFHHATETIFTNNIVIYMAKQSCLAHNIDNIIIHLVNGGFIDKWASLFIDKHFLNHRSDPKAVALKMDQLLGAFQLLFFGLCVSFLFFLLELVSLMRLGRK